MARYTIYDATLQKVFVIQEEELSVDYTDTMTESMLFDVLDSLRTNGVLTNNTVITKIPNSVSIIEP